MPEHGARQHAAFDIPALADEVLGLVVVRDALDVLLDDRSFVEIGGDIVRRGADQLDTARMRLVIRPGALEARQKRVMDIDAAAVEFGGEIVGQDLHVAGEHHQVDVSRLDDIPDRRLLLCLGLLGDGQVIERNAGQVVMQIGLARVIRDNPCDIDGQLTDAPAVEQVGEAVIES